MKKLIALCLILTMIFALPACGEKQVVDSAGTESTAEPSVQGTTELPQENIPTTEPETTEAEATNPEENETTEPETTEPAENQDETPTEPTTQKPPEKPTEPTTQKPTEKPTEPTTQKPTERPTEPPTTQKPTERPTEPPTTQKPTEKPTQPPTTQKPTEKPTEPPTTQKPTEKPTEPPTAQKPTEKPTQPPTTQKPTEKPTEPPATEAPKPVLPEYTPGSMAQQIVDLINQERANAGVGSVTISNTVSRLAYVRAQELRQSWSHTRPDGRAWHTVFSDYGVSMGRGIAENLAYTGIDSPENVVDLWMNSSGHRANMLNGSHTEIGIAVFYSGGNYYICTLYRS